MTTLDNLLRDAVTEPTEPQQIAYLNRLNTTALWAAQLFCDALANPNLNEPVTISLEADGVSLGYTNRYSSLAVTAMVNTTVIRLVQLLMADRGDVVNLGLPAIGESIVKLGLSILYNVVSNDEFTAFLRDLPADTFNALAQGDLAKGAAV